MRKELTDAEYEAKHKAKYSIQIESPAWEGYKYALSYSKEYGDCHGGATEFKTKQELIDYVRKFFQDCQGWDSIVNRRGDKPTPQNVWFKSFTSDITKMELFGNLTLSAFFSKTEQTAEVKKC